MKKLVPILLLGAALNSTAQTNYPGNIPGCVARYNFSPNGSSSLADVSNNNNVGVMHNMTATAGWRGVGNTAMQFDGQTSYANIASNPTLTPQTISMVSLVKFDAFYSGTCQGTWILGKGVPPNGNPGNYTLHVSDQDYDNNCNLFTPTEEMPTGFMGNATAPGNSPFTQPIQPGRWYFIAVTFDGTTVNCYQILMDSLAHATILQPNWSMPSGSSSIGFNNLDLTIGNQISSQYPYWFNGAMDEVAIFNRSLSTAEMQGVYDYLWAQPTAIAEVKAAAIGVNASTNAGTLHLNSTDGNPVGDVALYTIAGQEVAKTKFATTTATIDISALPRQMLFAKVIRGGVMSTIKVTNF